MSEPPVVGCGPDGEPDGAAPAVFWPALDQAERNAELELLADWVERLRHRYPHSTRIPDCWPLHTDMVEALGALRDYERGCFISQAAPTAAVEWQRAFRDIEQRIETWSRRFTCEIPGRGHAAAKP